MAFNERVSEKSSPVTPKGSSAGAGTENQIASIYMEGPGSDFTATGPDNLLASRARFDMLGFYA
jgi:hypothetical protein